MHEKITRDQLAALAGLNPEHFSRAFKKYTGRSPFPIREIAGMVGFEDPYYFSRVFKRQTGAAPSDHKRGNVPRVAALVYYGHLRALGVEPAAVNAAQVDGMQGELSDWPAYTQDIGMLEESDCDSERIRRYRPELIVTHSRAYA